MKRKIFSLIILIVGIGNMIAQPYTDYIGAGHTKNVGVTTSNGQAIRTINGSGLDGTFFDASRFAAQATLGVDSAYIAYLKNTGYENWINDQFTKTPSLMLPKMNSIWAEVKARRISAGQPEEDIFGPYSVHFNYAWWQNNLTNHMPNQNNDLLRQKVALALSEILVVSENSDLGDWGEAMSSYYDILLQGSFGTYGDLVKNVSKSFAMGYYLSHLNNPKTDIVANIRPDENYAREIMQLFTIGLVKLNPDGTQQFDANGFPIPTYDNNDIKEMAKIFTGLYGSQIMPCPDPPYPSGCICWNPNNPPSCQNHPNTCCWWPTMANFSLDPYYLIKTAPLAMSNANHEPGSKTMPDKTTVINIPNNGMAEVDAAINWLINHPNTPPFVSYRLIQRLVKSNPSPAYVQRVANKFINNGSGVRGDLKAVIKQILLDPEARSSNYLDDPNNGALKHPTLRATQFMKGNDIDSDLGRYWNSGWRFRNNTLHFPLHSPTVFNFYTPDYTPLGPIKDAGLVGPEFKLNNSSTAVGYLNEFFYCTDPWLDLINGDTEGGHLWWEGEWYNNQPLDSAVYLDTYYYESLADKNLNNNERLIHEMNKVLAHGQLTDNTLNLLRNIAKTIDNNSYPSDTWWWPRYKRYKVRTLMYFIMISPEYCVLK